VPANNPPTRPVTVPRIDPSTVFSLALYDALWEPSQGGEVEPPPIPLGLPEDPVQAHVLPIVRGDAPMVCLLAAQGDNELCVALSAQDCAVLITQLQVALARATEATAHPSEEQSDHDAP
jgi:hypothetical protein